MTHRDNSSDELLLRKMVANLSCDECRQRNIEQGFPFFAMNNPDRAFWEKGDYTRIAATMRESGEALVKSLGIKKGLRVLDLGCGDGTTTALPAAKLGAHVLGVDVARNLLEAANRHAQEESLTNLRFQEGHATDLTSLQDKTFDLVLSLFGAMFASRPFDAAKEMVRVTRPGGWILMGNWIPNDPNLIAQIFRIRSAFAPPPEGLVSPLTWGIEANVIERFASCGIPHDDVSFRRETYNFNFPEPPAKLVDEFRRYHGETMDAFEVAEKNGRAEDLRKELEALFERQNASTLGHATLIPVTFLRVTVTVN